MLSPRVFHLLIRHLDSIDEAVSLRFKRKRPYQETHLTSLLCDLLDDQTCNDEKLSYPRDELRRDLSGSDETVQVSIKIDTHEYTAKVERWVTQSDLGLVISFRDFITPEYSHSTAWLLQAKRLKPQLHAKLMYSERSRFDGMGGHQHQRMIDLGARIGIDFIRYLLYCPRPSLLDEAARAVLARQRVIATAGRIFDFTPGLELYHDLMSMTSTLAAGMFVAPVSDAPTRLQDVHRRIAEDTPPLSWFVVRHFSAVGAAHGLPVGHPPHPEGGFPTSVRISPHSPNVKFDPSEAATIAHGIVNGDCQVIEHVQRQPDIDGDFGFLPPHTMVIDVSVGQGLDFEARGTQ